MAMSWFNVESSTKKGDAANYPGKKRTVKYQVMFPNGHDGPDGKGDLVNATEFHKNCVEEYGETFVGKVLFKQLVVMAQGAPRPMMESGARDETIQTKMREWKADDVRVRNVKTVQVNAYQDALDRFNAATTFEEMVAARDALQAMIATMKTEAASTEVNGIEVSNGTEVTNESNGESEEDEEGSSDLPEEMGESVPPESSQPFQQRRGSRR